MLATANWRATPEKEIRGGNVRIDVSSLPTRPASLCTWAGVALRSWWPSQGDREPICALSGNPDPWFGPVHAPRLAKIHALAAAGICTNDGTPKSSHVAKRTDEA
jgi:hypothetical protein